MDVVTGVTYGRAVGVLEHDLLAMEVARLTEELAKLAARITASEPKHEPVLLDIKHDPAPLPSIDMFSATPESAEVGQPIILQWLTHNALAVALGTTPVEQRGSYQAIVSPGPGNNAWTLYATNADGVTITKHVAIQVMAHEAPALAAPVIEYFTATPPLGPHGTISLLAWKVTGAVDVELGAMDVFAEGTYAALISPFASANVWVLHAQNANGDAVMQELTIGLVADSTRPSMPLSIETPATSITPIHETPAQPFRVGRVRYSTLQAALDAMTDGDTLQVHSGGQSKNGMLANIQILRF